MLLLYSLHCRVTHYNGFSKNSFFMSVPSPGSNPLLLTHPLLQHHRQRLPFDLNRRVSRRWFHRLSPSQTEEQNLRLRHHHPPPLRQVSSTSTTLLILYFAPYTTSSIPNRWILTDTRPILASAFTSQTPRNNDGRSPTTSSPANSRRRWGK